MADDLQNYKLQLQQVNNGAINITNLSDLELDTRTL